MIVKMPTIVGILTFMCRINFVLSRVEHEKSFITSGPGFLASMLKFLVLITYAQEPPINAHVDVFSGARGLH